MRTTQSFGRPFSARLVITSVAFFVPLFLLVTPAISQSALRLENFQHVDGDHIHLVTDLPPGEELGELVRCFDLAVAQWGRLFSVTPAESADWKCTAYVMLDRDRFRRAGLIPSTIPEFPHGYQWGDQLWVNEQPSPYYRRHLLLHEGTHWFLWRKHHTTGPPWLMEGLAEWLATHRWDAAQGRLEMGIIPRTKEEVPYWGRIKILQDQLHDGTAPSLENVLRYDASAHRRVDAYAWSWAAVLFFHSHPESQQAFDALLRGPMTPGSSMTRTLFRRLQSKWPALRAAWSVWVSELDYGADLERAIVRIAPCSAPTETSTLQLDVSGGWQASGVCVEPGTKLVVSAEGEFTLADVPHPWRSTPGGVTLDYYRGRPLGQLLMTILAVVPKEAAHTEPVPIIPIGTHRELTVERGGELFFRVNESIRDLHDNRGKIDISITRVP